MLPGPQPLQLPSRKARGEKRPLERVFKVRRPSRPKVRSFIPEQDYKKWLRVPATSFSPWLWQNRGEPPAESKAPFLQTAGVQLRGGFSTKMPFSDVSRPSLSQLAAPNTQGEPREQLVPARSAQRDVSPTHPISRHVPEPCFNYFLLGIRLICHRPSPATSPLLVFVPSFFCPRFPLRDQAGRGMLEGCCCVGQGEASLTGPGVCKRH